MADANLRTVTVTGKAIRTTDVIVGVDPTEADLAVASRTDTLAEVIATIFQNPPATLTATQQAALRTLIAASGITDTALADDASTESTTDGASRQAIAEALDLLAALAGAEFTGAVTIGSPSGGPLTVDGENAGNSTIMKIFTPASGTQKAFGAGRDGEFDWVQFAGEIVTGKPGFALGTGTARDTNLYREEADHLRTDDEFSADEISIHGTLADTQDNLGIAAANPAGDATDEAVKLDVRGTIYAIPDDVEDVTDTGLPALTAANYKQIFIDHDTPRVWVGHREIISAVDAVGSFGTYADSTPPTFRGVVSGTSPPSSLQDGQYYYALGNHGWWRGVLTHGIVIGRQVSFRTLFSDADWLGEQPNDSTAAGLVDDFDNNRRYLYYSTSSGNVELLDNGTYVAATDRIEHFTAEPISQPNVVGTITGITAGAGLTGGGSSGQVTVDVDPSEADFPTIPVDKGGTGAVTAAAARAALGITAGGFTLRFGAGVPANTLGDNDDWYLATASGGWYEKASGAWELRYTDQTGAGGGLTQAQVLALIADPAEQGNTDTWPLAKIPNLPASRITSGAFAAARIPAAIARLASPALTGTPTVPTAAAGTDTTQAASTAFVAAAIAAIGGTAHDLIVGWSADAAISDAEIAAGATSDTDTATIPISAGNLYLFVWRADPDGGDPSEVHIAGGGNQRNIFGAAVARTVGTTAGQLIVSVTTQNAGLLGGEELRVV